MDHSFEFKDTIHETLGIEFVEYTKERVVLTMPVLPRVHQPFHIMHGGVSVVLAESVASSGSYQFIDRDKQRAVGLEINANHIRSVADGMVKAVGVPVHVGRRTWSGMLGFMMIRIDWYVYHDVPWQLLIWNDNSHSITDSNLITPFHDLKHSIM